MDKDIFIDEAFADWEESLLPSAGAITKAIRLAKTDIGIDLAAVVAGSDEQTLFENRVQYHSIKTALILSAQEYSSGAAGNRSDIFEHYRSLLEMLQAEWAELSAKLRSRISGGFQAYAPRHIAPGRGYDGLGRLK